MTGDILTPEEASSQGLVDHAGPYRLDSIKELSMLIRAEDQLAGIPHARVHAYTRNGSRVAGVDLWRSRGGMKNGEVVK